LVQDTNFLSEGISLGRWRSWVQIPLAPLQTCVFI
jgi:hypothetical protein